MLSSTRSTTGVCEYACMHACVRACVCSYVATELIAITVPHSKQPQGIITIDISFTDYGFTKTTSHVEPA